MVIITFKNGETKVYNEDSPKLITLWKKVESISSVVYGEYMDGISENSNQTIIEADPVTPDIPHEPIGDFIRAKRSLQGLKQSELIDALNMDVTCTAHRKQDSAYAKNFISRVENGHIAPSLFEFQCILNELGLESQDATLVGRWYYPTGQYKQP